jgi:hypothetical protein
MSNLQQQAFAADRRATADQVPTRAAGGGHSRAVVVWRVAPGCARVSRTTNPDSQPDGKRELSPMVWSGVASGACATARPAQCITRSFRRDRRVRGASVCRRAERGDRWRTCRFTERQQQQVALDDGGRDVGELAAVVL